MALKVKVELNTRIKEADQLRKLQLQRAKYEADLARRHYMQVDPDNHLVADSLEAEWNNKLRALKEAHEEYERKRKTDSIILKDEQKAQILSIATDFPQLWNDPKTSNRDKKQMVRLLIEDVTLEKNTNISINIRFKGGRLKSLNVLSPLNAWQLHKTNDAVISQIDKLLDHHTDAEVANILNNAGQTSGTGKKVHRSIY